LFHSPDGRIDARLKQNSRPDKQGRFVPSPVSSEYVLADGRFVTSQYGEQAPPSIHNGIARVFTQSGGKAAAETAVACSPTLGGFLDGRFLSDDAKPQSVVDLAMHSDVSKGVTQDNIDGVDCDTAEWSTRFGTLDIWVAPSQGYNIVKFSLEGRVPPSGDERAPPRGPSSIHFQSSGFKSIENRVATAGGRCETVYYEAKTGRVWTSITTAERMLIEMDPKFDDPALFTVKNVPDGIPVHFEDAITPQHISYVWWHGAPKPAVDVTALGQIDSALAGSTTPPAETIIRQHSNVLIWLVIAVAACGFLVVLIIARRRKGALDASR